MEVQSDHGLLVVSLENCITSDTSCDLGKATSCIYTAPLSNNTMGHETSVVQLAGPVQCIGQTIPRIQHQHLTQLQPIQYSQTVSYETGQQLQHGTLVSNHTLYQPMSVSTAPLHHYTASNPTLHNPYMSTPTLPLLTPSPSFPNPPPPMDDLTSDQTDPTASLSRNEGLPEPTYPAEGFDYFLEIQNYLTSDQYPPGVSDNYKKCLKKRAQNYLIIDGKLYHNRKQPKEVIMRKDQQEDMLSDIHIVKETGIHLGIKKMFNKLHMKYFWRGMYTDVVNFVKKCDKCSDPLDPVRQRQVIRPGGRDEGDSDNTEDEEDPAPLSPCSMSSLRARSTSSSVARVWKKVEVQMHGPFKKTSNRNEFILTMADPDSRWCCARAIPGSGHPTHLADFVFNSFCNYGFARCSLVGCSQDLCDAVSDEYTSRVTKLGEVFSSATLEHLESQLSSCCWVEPLLERMVQAHPVKWDKYLDHFLFQYRIGELKEFTPLAAESPFSLMFQHNPLGFTAPEEDKENINDNNPGYQLRRRKPHTSVMQCRHCESLFTSKISFRIHQRKHLGQSGHRKHMLGRKRMVKPKNDVNSLSTQPDVQPSDAWRESTVKAVKALLSATKEERRRRGKYRKYTVELQEQMASYAVKHGNPQAVRYFSEMLGTTVSESTIRNLVKIHNAFTPGMKVEIGRFATNYGVETAAKSFSEWLKRDVSQNVVGKFKSMYINARPENVKMQIEKQLNQAKKFMGVNKQNVGKRYSPKIKEEIGEYACNHSVQDTAEYFTEKLQMMVQERTVKRFYKLYVDKCKNQNSHILTSHETQIVEPLNSVNQNTTHVNVYNNFQPIQNTPVTLYQLNSSSNGNTTVCYQTTSSPSVITPQNNESFSYHPMQSFSSPLPQVPLAPPAPPYPVSLVQRTNEKSSLGNLSLAQQNQQTQTCLIPQHSLLVTQNRDNSLLTHFMATSQPIQQTILTILPEKETPKVEENEDMVNRHELQASFNTEAYNQESLQTPMVTVLLTDQEKEQDILTLKAPESHEIKEAGTVKKPCIKKQIKKKENTSKKRGTYTAYSPEIRAEIGKYAAEHGSIKACQHFAKILGHDVPESTARGLKEKYLTKKKHCPVTSLGYSQRGRPLRLGKYDELVQECIKELVRSGEKVSSFLAITTAKEILNKHEPALLEENGGALKLNTTWAKSFLKRIGVHNNS